MSQGKESRLQAQLHYEEAEIKRLAHLVRQAHDRGWTTREDKYKTQLATAKESKRMTEQQLEGVRLAAEMWADDMIEAVGLKNKPNSDAHNAWNHLRDAALSLPELTELGLPRY
jgi:hypothetical protein